jgi:hypothetical protein
MKKLALLCLAAVVGYSGWWITRHASSASKNLAFDRLWIDHLPTDQRDTVKVFVALTEQPFGVFQASSFWSGSYEMFRYEANGDEIRALFGQTGQRERFNVRGTKCDEGQFSFCLDVDGASRGARRYYSMKGWEIGGGDADAMKATVDAKLQALLAAQHPVLGDQAPSLGRP